MHHSLRLRLATANGKLFVNDTGVDALAAVVVRDGYRDTVLRRLRRNTPPEVLRTLLRARGDEACGLDGKAMCVRVPTQYFEGFVAGDAVSPDSIPESLSIYLSIYLPTYLSIYLSIYIYIYIYIYICSCGSTLELATIVIGHWRWMAGMRKRTLDAPRL